VEFSPATRHRTPTLPSRMIADDFSLKTGQHPNQQVESKSYVKLAANENSGRTD